MKTRSYSSVYDFFTAIWQEDCEIEFTQLALEGIPDPFKNNGIPLDRPQVRQYLRDLVAANRVGLLECSDEFWEYLAHL